MTGESRNKHEENPLDEFGNTLGDRLEGRVVEVKNSSVNHVNGGQVSLHQSATRNVQASAVQVEDSAILSVRAGSADIADSALFFAAANELKAQKVSSSVLIGRRVEANETRALLVLALQVRGSIRTVLTPLTAFAAGAGFATMLFLLRLVLSKIAPASRPDSHKSTVA